MDVLCSRNEMKVIVNLNETGSFGKDVNVYLDKLKDYPGEASHTGRCINHDLNHKS